MRSHPDVGRREALSQTAPLSQIAKIGGYFGSPETVGAQHARQCTSVGRQRSAGGALGTPDCPVPARIEPREHGRVSRQSKSVARDHALVLRGLLRKLAEVRRGIPLVSVGRDMVRPHRVHGDEQDVRLALRRGRGWYVLRNGDCAGRLNAGP